MGRPVFYICPLRTLRLAINCLAVRGVRPGLRISPHGRFPPVRAPFFHSVEAKSIRLNQGFASGKTLVRRGAAGRFRARGRCGTPGHRLRLAMNCFAVRGVRPGLRISPHGRFPPVRAPFFHSVEAKLIRLNQGFASGKTLVRRGAAGRFRARGRCETPGHRLRLAINCFAVRGVRPGLRISPHGRFPPAGPPFSIRLRRSQFTSTKVLPPAKRLCAAGRRGAFAPVGDAGHLVTGSGWQ